MKSLLLSVLIICTATPIYTQTNSSAYTELGRKFCKTLLLRDAELVEYKGRCPGLGGYQLLVNQEDSSFDLAVLTPTGTETSLNLWDPVRHTSSSLGPKAEWRLKTEAGKSTPIGLIVRYNFEEKESPTRKASFLIVIKLTEKEICVTDKINQGPNANEEARRRADLSANKACLKTN